MTAELSFPGRVVALHRGLTDAGIAHAFGGAIALAYYGEPRATVDIDINVFLRTEALPSLNSALGGLGIPTQTPADQVERDGQFKEMWGRVRVDIFMAYDDFHWAMQDACRSVPFEGTEIPILSAEHLIVCKAVFDRPKDWLDLEPVMAMQAHLDEAEILRWAAHIVGTDDERYRRLSDLLDTRRPR